jgi:cytochrome c-type biogenesis protein CcmE
MTKRQKRMAAVVLLLVGLSVAAVLGFTAFSKNMMYFQTPSDIAAGTLPEGARIRLGGLVEKGSLQRGDGLVVNFSVADCEANLPVRYEGILPDLFREGQGIVATGHMDGKTFVADEVLAKHDENYMPPELAEKLVTPDGKHSCEQFKSMGGKA